MTAMEDVLDADKKITHEKLSTQMEEIIYDPSKIGVKVAAEVVDVCFTPIIQVRVSGQDYN
jgi:nucleosome binding factor SPN SPT16 subunit